MIKMRYAGITNPVGDFEELRPLVAKLRAMQQKCKPFGRDWHAIAMAIAGLDSAAYHFVGVSAFYGASADSAGPIRPRLHATARNDDGGGDA
jgi:hypothetical protein